MRVALGVLILAVAASPAFANILVAVPAPDLATGLPAVLAVIGAYAVTRFARRR
jgi:hypothetical protein